MAYAIREGGLERQPDAAHECLGSVGYDCATRLLHRVWCSLPKLIENGFRGVGRQSSGLGVLLKI